eukprot:gene5690-338_t
MVFVVRTPLDSAQSINFILRFAYIFKRFHGDNSPRADFPRRSADVHYKRRAHIDYDRTKRLLENNSRAATARILKIPRETLRNIIRRDPSLCERIHREVGEDILESIVIDNPTMGYRSIQGQLRCSPLT